MWARARRSALLLAAVRAWCGARGGRLYVPARWWLCLLAAAAVASCNQQSASTRRRFGANWLVPVPTFETWNSCFMRKSTPKSAAAARGGSECASSLGRISPWSEDLSDLKLIWMQCAGHWTHAHGLDPDMLKAEKAAQQ
jgi:hypothetical protein